MRCLTFLPARPILFENQPDVQRTAGSVWKLSSELGAEHCPPEILLTKRWRRPSRSRIWQASSFRVATRSPSCRRVGHRRADCSPLRSAHTLSWFLRFLWRHVHFWCRITHFGLAWNGWNVQEMLTQQRALSASVLRDWASDMRAPKYTRNRAYTFADASRRIKRHGNLSG